VIGLFKPTFLIRDAGTLPVNCRPPGSCRSWFGSWKQSSRKEATHLPTGAGINGLTRHGGDHTLEGLKEIYERYV